jgi:hypothetical protein
MEVNGPPTGKDFDKVKLICEELTKRIKELQERTGGE